MLDRDEDSIIERKQRGDCAFVGLRGIAEFTESGGVRIALAEIGDFRALAERSSKDNDAASAQQANRLLEVADRRRARIVDDNNVVSGISQAWKYLSRHTRNQARAA